MKRYSPRRAGKKWLAGAPAYVLDCFDNGGLSKRNGSCDRYRVLFCGDLLETDGTFAGTYVQGLGMSDAPTHPQGVSLWFELKAYEAAAYRYRSSHQRVKWADLPEHIRRHVIARATTD